MAKTLIIPDVHQEVAWANAVMAREPDVRARDVIFLGDYWDKHGRSRRPADFDETCVAVRGWAEAGHTLLPGNHDARYIEQVLNPGGRRFEIGCKRVDPAPFARHFPDAGAIATTFRHLHRTLTLSAVANRPVLLTHAGLHSAHVPAGAGEWDLDRILALAWEQTQASFWRDMPRVVQEVGICRGGTHHADTGGVLWRDHDEEGSLLVSHQICGHTGLFDTVDIQRVIGLNQGSRFHICLDGRQSTYGVLDDRSLTIRACTPAGASLLFAAQLPGGRLENIRELTLDFLTDEFRTRAGRFDAPGFSLILSD